MRPLVFMALWDTEGHRQSQESPWGGESGRRAAPLPLPKCNVQNKGKRNPVHLPPSAWKTKQHIGRITTYILNIIKKDQGNYRRKISGLLWVKGRNALSLHVPKKPCHLIIFCFKEINWLAFKVKIIMTEKMMTEINLFSEAERYACCDYKIIKQFRYCLWAKGDSMSLEKSGEITPETMKR